jgi:adenylyltransferase/sulfurtransferase
MSSFHFTRTPISVDALRAEISDPVCGGYAAFEGWVRNHNEGQPVRHLEYEAFEPLAIKEGERIIAEAVAKFGIEHAACVHRIGDLAIGEMAVWVGVSARHRHEAFVACRYIIDEVKHRVPIWKKEHYENGDSGWVNCERCAAPSEHESHGLPGETVARHSHVPHEHAAHGATAAITSPFASHTRTPAHSHSPSAAAPDYSRQMALKEVGVAGQAKLRKSRVLVVGAGGLGVPVLTYLAGAGVGRIGIVDGDTLDASNLHRQTLYALSDVGKPKAELAAERLRALNSEVDVRGHVMRLDAGNGLSLIEPYDLVIDCTDNFSTKFLLNDLCMHLGKPAILSSVYQYEGQLQVIRPDRNSACLRCVWPEATRDGLVGNCAEAGVLGPVPGVFGSLQALEALKVLMDLPGQLNNELFMLDLTALSVTRVRARRAESCETEHRTRFAAQYPGTGASETQRNLEISFVSLNDATAQGFNIVDVREPREVAEIPTPAAKALHIPLGELLQGTPNIARAEKHLLVCASGRRSLAAAQELQTKGFTEVYSLKSGIAALDRQIIYPPNAK